MLNETGLTKNAILSELSRSPHGKLVEYIPVGTLAAQKEPEFLAHLVAWNHQKGQIRDSKVALPIVSLSGKLPVEFEENALAHLSTLGPREFLKAITFAKNDMKFKASQMRPLRRLVEAYLVEMESDWNIWQRRALQHKNTLRTLYASFGIKPSERVNMILFGRTLDRKKVPFPKGSIFEVVANLKNMSPVEAAGTIIQKRIPFLIAQGALGVKMKEPDCVLALIKAMSPTEVITNTKMLEKLGVKTNPALRGAFEEALARVAASNKNVLKTTKAAEAIEDEGLKAKLQGVQHRQLESIGIEGNWLVLGDKSASMNMAIEVATEVAGTLAKMVKGKVWLVFFDTMPQTMDVTGLPLDKIKEKTKYIKADGGTSIGCGLQRMLDSKTEVDGIAVVSDAQENTNPSFVGVYKQYAEMFGKQVPVYLYRCQVGSSGYHDVDLKNSMHQFGYDLQEFDLTRGTDYYALPNLAQTMRTQRYSLLDDIMNTPLLKLKDVFKTVWHPSGSTSSRLVIGSGVSS